jgi:Inositol 1,3,4-trisphosphate 5/6-kinase ATP-grasp domain
MAIKTEFGLSLFGFDLIVPVRHTAPGPRSGIRSGSQVDAELPRNKTAPVNADLELKSLIDPSSLCESVLDAQYTDDDGELVVIDVNYFPSYKEVPDFPNRLRKFLRLKAGME